jgi:phosphatidylinositol alpha-1,6-mannosyltransferase
VTIARLAAAEGYKGHDRVIRVLPRVVEQHPDTLYVVVGEGDDRARLEKLAAQCGVHEKVCFAGRVPVDELPDYLHLADVMVMPSTGEGFGIVFLEAVASGIDVIGGNQDGSLDPLADGILGRAVDPENGAELASAICAMLRDPVARVARAGRFGLSAFHAHLEALVSSTFEAVEV